MKGQCKVAAGQWSSGQFLVTSYCCSESSHRYCGLVGSNHAVAQCLRSKLRLLSESTSQKKSVLLLFATLQTNYVRICTDWELPASLWSLEYYLSFILNLCQQLLPSNSLNSGIWTSKCFWRALDHLQILGSLASNQEIFVSVNYPKQTIALESAQAATQLVTFFCHAMEPTQGDSNFFSAQLIFGTGTVWQNN